MFIRYNVNRNFIGDNSGDFKNLAKALKASTKIQKLQLYCK